MRLQLHVSMMPSGGKFHGKGKLTLTGLPTESGEFVQEGDWANGMFVPPEGEGGGKDKKKKKK